VIANDMTPSHLYRHSTIYGCVETMSLSRLDISSLPTSFVPATFRHGRRMMRPQIADVPPSYSLPLSRRTVAHILVLPRIGQLPAAATDETPKHRARSAARPLRFDAHPALSGKLHTYRAATTS
jgi:hypothetical protein